MKLNVQLHVGLVEPSTKILRPIKNRLQCKAEGGLFTSTYLGEKLGSDWVQWCICEDFGTPSDNVWKGWLLYPREDLKVCVVDSIDDMNFVYDTYGKQFIEGSNMEQVDFVELFKDYDAFHITQKGERETRYPFRFSENPRIDRGMRSFYGFDCESTHFKDIDAFEKIVPIVLKNINLEHTS